MSQDPALDGEPLLGRRRLSLSYYVAGLRLKTSVWSELGGAVGDLGTYIPIALALSLVNGVDLGTTLVFTGLYNGLTGALFGVPMPVQPMKSIAAVAISESAVHLTVPQIMAAGITTAGVLFLLGVTGLMSLCYRLIPFPVVRGVQLSQGLQFAFSAVNYIRHVKGSTAARPWLGPDGLLLALAALLLMILTAAPGAPRALARIPAALLVFLAGAGLCIVRDPSVVQDLRFGPSKIRVVKISAEDWKTGFLRAAVPQIPLSVLNSVVAVCKLSSDLFPEREVSAATVAASVGAMNLVGCWFGAMPVCHGAGGLAGQYRCGGRSGACVVILGAGKLVLGLALGSSVVRVLAQFPVGLLGVLLLFSGVELAMAARDVGDKQGSFVMLVCAAVSLTGSSAALGFVCGVLLHLLLKLRRVCASWIGRDGDDQDDDDEIVVQRRREPC
ncbi:molybdate transporter 2-like [Wolffia australiana]